VPSPCRPLSLMKPAQFHPRCFYRWDGTTRLVAILKNGFSAELQPLSRAD
jgi:hypothetical protein